jgi:glycosyltransferase involved in cell wall biosynthesis
LADHPRKLLMRASVANIVFNEFRNDARVEKTCRSLAANGFAVTLFALSGEGLPAEEERDGFRVVRCPGPGRLGSVIRMAFRLLWSAREFDVIHCNDLEPFPLAVMAKFLSGRGALVYDAHELETEKVSVRGLRKILSRWLEKALFSCADATITVGDEIADWYSARYAAERPQVVRNAPHLWKLKKTDLLRKRLSISPSTPIFLYVGSLQKGRTVEATLDAFTGAKDRAIVFMGYGGTSVQGQRLERLVRETAQRESNLFFHEPVSQGELLDYVASADVGVSLIEDICLSYRYCLPNKLFEYGMAGLPVMVSDMPEMRMKIEEYQCGVICHELSPVGISDAAEEIIAMDCKAMAANARRMAEEHCWEKQEKKLLALYDEILKVA